MKGAAGMIRLLSRGKPTAWKFRHLLRLYNPNVLKSDHQNFDYVEQGEWDKGFSSHYHSELKGLVEKYEANRVAAVRSARNKLLLLTPLFFIIPIIGWKLNIWDSNNFEDPSGLGFYFVIISYAAMFWLIKRSIITYQDSIKNEVFPKILEFMGDYSFSSHVPAQVKKYEKTGLIPSFNYEKNEDQIIGAYNGVAIELFESHLQRSSGTGKNRRVVTVFNGLILNLSMNKNFLGTTLVKQDRGILGNWFEKKFSNLENVKLEDPRFEKTFEVYSTDQIEARYLLTVSFMERLLQLAELFDKSGIRLCFQDNSLLIMIPLRKPIFEPGPITEPENFIDDAQNLLKEMHLIFQIIDILNLKLKLNL